MAHFAKIDENNVVTQVIVIDDSEEHRGEEFIHSLGLTGRWVQTSYNTRDGVHLNGGTPLRHNYASIGYVYNEELDAFLPGEHQDSVKYTQDSED